MLNSQVYKPENVVQEICVSMSLIKNSFLDDILDRGLTKRYSDDPNILSSDLKSIFESNNKLKLGKFHKERCVSDRDLSKMYNILENIDFDIHRDWDKLVSARDISRNIIDKLLVDEKLDEDMINFIYIIGPNKDSKHKEDIVIELVSGKQHSFFINKSLSLSKSSSFNTFADDFIGDEIENLFGPSNIGRWDELCRFWISLVYKWSKKRAKFYIEKFIDPKNINNIKYFQYFNIELREIKWRKLGINIKEFDKNISKLSDLMSEIWDMRDEMITDPEKVYLEWTTKKNSIMNDGIFNDVFTKSLSRRTANQISKMDDGFKLVDGPLKMRIMKILVNKFGCQERSIFYLGNSGDSFHQIPPRRFFREHYNKIDIMFDYGVSEIDIDDRDSGTFKIRVKVDISDMKLMDVYIYVDFSGGEMSGKFNSKFKYFPVDDFNKIIYESSNIKD